MQSSKLVKLLKSLKKEELRRLHKFLQSPYHNTSDSILNLFRLLRAHYPGFDSPKLDKKIVFEKIYPKKSFSTIKMLKLMSKLSKLVEEFLSLETLSRDGAIKRKLLLSAYQHKALSELYTKTAEEFVGQLGDDQFIGNLDYFQEKHFLHYQLYFNAKSQKEMNPMHLRQAMNNLDAYLILSKLQLIAEMETRKQIWAEQYDILLDEEIRLVAQNGFAQNHPIYQLYLNILDLYHGKDQKNTFSKSKSLFSGLIPQLKRQENQLLLQQLSNHCIRLVNGGNKAYQRDLFELYKLGLKHKLLIEGQRISAITYSNIAALSTQLNEMPWAHSFILQYEQYLKANIRLEVKALSLGFWHFHQNEYDQVIAALSNATFKDIRNNLKSKCLLLRTYYEQYTLDPSYYDLLLDKAAAFEKFIRRNKDLAPQKGIAYLNFVKYCRQLVQLKRNRENKKPLQEKLNNQPFIYYKDWLLEKLEN